MPKPGADTVVGTARATPPRSLWLLEPALALVLSQVVLSFGIPFALIPLVVLTAQWRTLGPWANRAWTTAAGVVSSVLLITLNGALLWLVLTGS